MKAATVTNFTPGTGVYISIHAAREGGDGIKSAASWLWEFQSTPPVKAATVSVAVSVPVFRISIHAAREGGDERISRAVDFGGISIHAAREGGDWSAESSPQSKTQFQSTPPVKAATVPNDVYSLRL